MPRYRIGIDIGGTFTDFCVLDEHGGEVFNAKVLSTPADLAQGVMQALDDFFGAERSPEDVSFLFHAKSPKGLRNTGTLRRRLFPGRPPLAPRVKKRGFARRTLGQGRSAGRCFAPLVRA